MSVISANQLNKAIGNCYAVRTARATSSDPKIKCLLVEYGSELAFVLEVEIIEQSDGYIYEVRVGHYDSSFRIAWKCTVNAIRTYAIAAVIAGVVHFADKSTRKQNRRYLARDALDTARDQDWAKTISSNLHLAYLVVWTEWQHVFEAKARIDEELKLLGEVMSETEWVDLYRRYIISRVHNL